MNKPTELQRFSSLQWYDTCIEFLFQFGATLNHCVTCFVRKTQIELLILGRASVNIANQCLKRSKFLEYSRFDTHAATEQTDF
jgi:hypothetical protein